MVSWTRIILTVFLGLALWAIATMMARADVRILNTVTGALQVLDLRAHDRRRRLQTVDGSSNLTALRRDLTDGRIDGRQG